MPNENEQALLAFLADGDKTEQQIRDHLGGDLDIQSTLSACPDVERYEIPLRETTDRLDARAPRGAVVMYRLAGKD